MTRLPALLLLAILALPAQAYTARELRADCEAAEELHNGGKSAAVITTPGPARCAGYVEGFADGYAITEHLADSVGVKLAALCPPPGPDLSRRLVRAVVAHLERQPPDTQASPATLVAGALSRAFPCSNSLEPRR
jgi:hypothetical protein